MIFDKLIDKYEQTVDGKKYLVEYYEPTIFPCWLSYRVKLFELSNGIKKCVLKSEANSHNMMPDCWMNKLKEEKQRLIRIFPPSSR